MNSPMLFRTILVAAVVASCVADRRAEPGVLLIDEGEQTATFLRNFNPLMEVGDQRWPATRAMYEPLLIFNAVSGDYVPWLATSYGWSDDHRVLRFELRRGVRWSDGTAFTAADVAFTFDLLRRHPALDLRGVWAFIEDVVAHGDHIVELRFRRVFIPGFAYLAQQPIVAAHVWKDVADPVTWTNPRPVGTGPFTEITTFQTQAYEVARNPHAWHPPAGPAGTEVRALRFLAFPSNDQTALALIHGELDWAGSFVPAIDRIFVGRDRVHHHYWFPPIDGGVMLYAATTRAPYDDVRVRKALSLAIDRALVVKVGMHDYVRAADATGLSDAHRRFRDPEAAAGDWVQHDPERAGHLLDDAGLRRGGDGWRRLPGGGRWSVAIQVPAGFSDWVRAAQVIVRGLRAAGIDARMQAYDFNAWYEKIQQGDFALALGWSEPYPQPYGFYRAMMSSDTRKPLGDAAPENWHRFALPRADELLRALEQTADAAEQHRLTVELQRLFVAHAPAIPLFPGPSWGEFNSSRFTGFPSADDPYAPLSPHLTPQPLLVLTRLRRVEAQ
jgi:peptide/nickel transport system substrate-binding protein